MRTWICFLVAILGVILCSTVCGQDASAVLGTQDSYLSVTGLAGTDVAVGRLGWHPSDSRVSVFVQGVWIKDIDKPNTEGFGGHFGATYDLAKKQDLNVVGVDVPLSWYIGAAAGALKPEDTGWQTSPFVLTGFNIFGKSTKSPAVVVELWGIPGKNISNVFADVESEGKIVVGGLLPF